MINELCITKASTVDDRVATASVSCLKSFLLVQNCELGYLVDVHRKITDSATKQFYIHVKEKKSY